MAPAPAATLAELAGTLIDLKRERAAEAARAAEVTRHLERERALLREEERLLRDRLAKAEEKLASESTERETLAKAVADKEALLADTARALAPLADALRTGLEVLPESLSRPLYAEHGDMPPHDAALTASVGRYIALALALARRLTETHAMREVVELPGIGRVEAGVLRIGGLAGWYVTDDGARAGRLFLSGSQWRAAPDDGIARDVRAAIDIARKRAAAAYVQLPLHTGASE